MCTLVCPFLTFFNTIASYLSKRKKKKSQLPTLLTQKHFIKQRDTPYTQAPFSFLHAEEWPFHQMKFFLQSLAFPKKISLNLLKPHFNFYQDRKQSLEIDRQTC